MPKREASDEIHITAALEIAAQTDKATARPTARQLFVGQ